jgi:hypothetical protein
MTRQASVILRTLRIPSRLLSSWVTAKKKKSKNESPRATLASEVKVIAQPHFAESARKEGENANYKVTEHASNRDLER